MAIIADILTQVDAAAAAVGATAFDAVAVEIVPVFRIGSVLVVALVGVNLMAQAVPMTLRNGLGLMVRIAVASAFLSSWTNFNAVYGVQSAKRKRPRACRKTILQPKKQAVDAVSGEYRKRR